MVGTRKGLWIGTSDEARADWEFTGPHFDMEEVYSCLVDTRGDTAPAARRRLVELARARRSGAPTTSARPGRRPRTARSASPRTPTRRVERVWQLTPGAERRGRVRRAPSRPPSGGRPTAARRFALEQALWDHPHRPEWGAGFGGQAFHTLLPHPDDPRLGDRGDLDRRRLPDHRRRRSPGSRATRASARSSCPRASSTPSSGSACTRSPGTRAGPSGCTCRTTAASTAPTTRADPGSRSPTGCPADFGFPIVVHPHEPDTIFVFPINGGEKRYPPEAQGPGLALPRRRRDLGGARRRPARRLLRRGDARRHVRRRPRPPGLYFGARNGAVWASRRRGRVVAPDRRRPPRRDGGAGAASGLTRSAVTRTVRAATESGTSTAVSARCVELLERRSGPARRR